jgi:hypothetical protein
VNDKLMDRVTLKFLNAEHVDSILINGTLMFSGFSHFRKKEGDRWIGDPDEATTAVEVGNTVIEAADGGAANEPWKPIPKNSCLTSLPRPMVARG